jgi:uncharacterized membrane protein YkoI
MKKAVIAACVSALVAGAAAAYAVQAQGQKELQARATFSMEQATATALATFPGGTIKESELEDEDGLLIYSFDVLVNGVMNEVEIDATTGRVIFSGVDDEDDDEDENEDDD